MIEWIIRRSVANRFSGADGRVVSGIWGTWTIINTPVDAAGSFRCAGDY